MACENIQLLASPTSDVKASVITIGTSSSAAPVLYWETITGPDNLAWFDIALRYRAISKAPTESSGFGDWTEEYYERIPVSQCHASQIDGGWAWHHEFNVLGMDADMIPNGWSFSGRKYDAINIGIGMKGVYPDGSAACARCNASVIVAYIADLTFNSARTTASAIKFGTSVTSGWQRIDDAVEITSLVIGGKELTYGKTSVLRERDGTVTVKLSDIRAIPDGSEVRVSAQLRSSFTSYSSTSAALPLVDKSACAPITATASVADGSVNVRVVANESSYDPPQRVIVKLVDGGGFDDDTVTLTSLPGTATFKYVPLDVDLEFAAQGFRDDCRSSTSTTHAKVSSHGAAFLDSVDGRYRAVIRYDLMPKWTAEPEKEIVKLSGRRRDSAFYGNGGTVTASLDGAIVSFDVVGTPMVRQLDDEFELIAFAGDCYCRLPNGVKRRVAIDQVSVGQRNVSNQNIKDVSVSMTEVAR